MSTYILMKILESAPDRYDAGIRILTLGAVDRAYNRLTSRISKGQVVLDIGCGTGALTIRAAKRGAKVKGIDINAGMLEIAKKRVSEENLADLVELCEMGVAELDSEEAQKYDAVMSGLCFSELSPDEIAYVLKHARRVLKPGGILLLADEVRPSSFLKRIVYTLLRIPLVIITYLLTQTTTRAIKGLPESLEREGFKIESVRTGGLGGFMELEARKSGGTSNE